MKVTLRDVALAAGVSMTAASMALSDSGRLSGDTREKVRKAARELGYKVKTLTPLRMDEDPTVGILMSIDVEWAFIFHFIRPIMEEIGSTLAGQGLTTILIPISRRDSAEDIYTKIRKSRAIAVAALHYGNEVLFEKLETSGIPSVLIMNSNFQDRFYSVCVDDYQGAYEGACRLIRRGHRAIGYLDCIRQDLPQLLVDRFFGFRKAVEEYGLEFDDSMKARVEPEDMRGLAIALERMLAENRDMTGIFALDDDLALRIVVALSMIGKRVPADLSLIAPGDVLDYGLPHIPRICTMRIDTAYMGKIAAQMIVNRIQHNPQELHVLKVKQQLVRRGSVATGPAGLSAGEEPEPVDATRQIYPVGRSGLGI